MKKGILILVIIFLTLILSFMGFIGYVKNNENKKEDKNKPPVTEEVVTEEFMLTQEAVTLGETLYQKANTIAFDKTKYTEFVIESSEMEGYQNKILDYVKTAKEVFKDPLLYISTNETVDSNGDVYFHQKTETMSKSFIKTELQLKEIDYKKITFNAVTTYCYMENRKCNETELLTKYSKDTRDFELEKINDKWVVSKFSLAY